MNRKWQLLLIFMAAGACAGRAALIAGWNFNNQTIGTAPASIAADHGSGSLDLSKLANSFDANIGSSSSGTSVNAVAGDSPGSDFFVQGGSGEVENGRTIIFSCGTVGYRDIVLTYATDRSGTGFTSQQWSYSTDNVNFTSFKTITSIGTSYSATGVETVDFSTEATVNNDSVVYFQLKLNGATGSAGSNHFDNFQINATPIPELDAGAAISAAGLFGICVLRLWRQRRQQNLAAIN